MPTAANCNTNYAQAFTADGLQIAVCDGTVRTVANNSSGLTWRNALLPNDVAKFLIGGTVIPARIDLRTQ